MPKAIYLAFRQSSLMGRDFVRKLVSHFYTEGEIACRSVNGGRVTVGQKRDFIKTALNRKPRFMTIIEQATKEWPSIAGLAKSSEHGIGEQKMSKLKAFSKLNPDHADDEVED